MVLRKILVGVLTIMMFSPVWGGEPLGSVTESSKASVRDTKLTQGSTVFPGDVIQVDDRGDARVSLHGGSQAEILGNSSVQFAVSDNKIQMVVNRGQASFHTSGANELSAVVADATVRPADTSETSAVIQSLSETHAIVAAQKGALLLTTAHDGKVIRLSEGEAADLSASDDGNQNGGAVPAGKSAPTFQMSKKAVYWTVGILGAGGAIAAYFLSRNETKLTPTQLSNEISPSKLN